MEENSFNNQLIADSYLGMSIKFGLFVAPFCFISDYLKIANSISTFFSSIYISFLITNFIITIIALKCFFNFSKAIDGATGAYTGFKHNVKEYRFILISNSILFPIWLGLMITLVIMASYEKDTEDENLYRFLNGIYGIGGFVFFFGFIEICCQLAPAIGYLRNSYAHREYYMM